MKPYLLADRPSLPARLRRLLVEKQSTFLATTVFILVFGTFEIGPIFGFRFAKIVQGIPMPLIFNSDGARWILVFFLGLFAFLAAASALKCLENSEVSGWQQTEAEIIRSQAGFRLITPAKGMPRNHRIADLTYRFSLPALDGRPKDYFGSRIRIDEIIPEEEVDSLLARYPVGSRVTVYFDPNAPSRNVLERQADGGRTIHALAVLACVFAAIAIPAMWLATHGAASLAILPLNRWGWAALICGLVSFGFFKGEGHQRRWLAGLKSWPKVSGVVVSSAVAAYDSGHRRRWNNGQIREFVTNYMPVVEYRYEVGGQSYLSRNILADMTIGGSEDFAERYVQRYRPGTAVEVSYDPANPARAAIEPTTGFGWTFLIAGTGFAIVAGLAALKAFA